MAGSVGVRWGVAGAVLLALVTLGTGAARAQEPDAAPEASPSPAVKKIKMFVESWRFSPNVIRVKQGTRLHIDFESHDASHSFVLKGYKINVPLPQDSTRDVEFVVDKVGEFPWYCGRPCGDGCPKMSGKLIVEPPDAPAPEPDAGV